MSEESLGPHRGKVLNTGNLIKFVSKDGRGEQVPEAGRSFSFIPVLSKRNEIAQRSPVMSRQSNLLVLQWRLPHRIIPDRLLASLNFVSCWGCLALCLTALLHKLLDDYVLQACRSSRGEWKISKPLPGYSPHP